MLELRPEGGEEEGETLEFRTEQAQAIVDQVTAIAVQLAAAKKAGGGATPGGSMTPSATGSPQSLSGGDSPAPAKRGGIRRRFSVSSGTTKSSAIPEAVDTFDAKDEKGKSVKLVVGTMGLQVSGKKGIPTTHLYQGINAWETKADGLQKRSRLEVILAPAAGQPT